MWESIHWWIDSKPLWWRQAKVALKSSLLDWISGLLEFWNIWSYFGRFFFMINYLLAQKHVLSYCEVGLNLTMSQNNCSIIFNCSDIIVVILMIMNSFSIIVVVIKCLYRSSKLLHSTLILKGNSEVPSTKTWLGVEGRLGAWFLSMMLGFSEFPSHPLTITLLDKCNIDQVLWLYVNNRGRYVQRKCFLDLLSVKHAEFIHREHLGVFSLSVYIQIAETESELISAMSDIVERFLLFWQ